MSNDTLSIFLATSCDHPTIVSPNTDHRVGDMVFQWNGVRYMHVITSRKETTRTLSEYTYQSSKNSILLYGMPVSCRMRGKWVFALSLMDREKEKRRVISHRMRYIRPSGKQWWSASNDIQSHSTYLLNGGCLPIWFTSWPSQSLITTSQTDIPGRTSRSFNVVRPICSAKGVVAELAKHTFIPGYWRWACSCNATRAPSCSAILSYPE